MMKKILYLLPLLLGLVLFSSLRMADEQPELKMDTPVWDMLQQFGKAAPNHIPDESIAGATAERGEGIVKYGITSKPKGGKIDKQSNHFVCTSCHNIQQEDPDLTNPNPADRLKFASEKNIPFLQGTTLFGAVNRSSFYNDDYEKKYGELVKPTRNNLREAIQLCAIECSQGRRLKDWELESVLKYLWTLEYKLSDLQMTESELDEVNELLVQTQGKNSKAIELIESKYRQDSPAHFVTPPEDRKAGYGLTGNPENGKLIYDLSCLHCHEYENFSSFSLDDSKKTLQYLEKHFTRYTRYSVYQVARYGTSPLPGKRAYMPQYTKERMSDQQMEDLRTYIEQGSK